MRIWIVNQYAQPPSHPGGTRHHILARSLAGRGHDVTIVASALSYLTRTYIQASASRVEAIDGVRYVWIPSPGYSDNGVRRGWSMVGFAANVMRNPLLQRAPHPDVVVGSSPHPFAAAAARRLARRSGVPFVLEVRDLWPESLVDVGALAPSHPFVRMMRMLMDSLYRSATRIVTLLPEAAKYIEGRGARPEGVTWIPNGVDVGSVGSLGPLPANSAFTVMYAGAHGKANGLDAAVEAARLLQKDGAAEDVRFRLVGDGTEKPRLAAQAMEAGLRNISFEDPVPKHRIYDLLREADAFLLPLAGGDVFRYGVSPNKLFDYLAVGRPVIFAVAAGNNPVEEAGAGLSIPPDDGAALVAAVREMAALTPEERAEMGRRGRAYVEANHDLVRLCERFERLLEDAKSEIVQEPMSKRAADVLVSGLGLVVLALPMLAIAVGIRVVLGPPVLFRQTRPGRLGKPFEIHKFRTMRDAIDAEGRPLEDDQRLTRLGMFLRRTSLDELPELFNVLKGDMSLVGPRPLLMEYLDRYTPEQARRHEVKPGLTGWAQVHGRNALSWDDKLALDVWYVDHRSVRLDLRILLMTVREVLRGRGISAEGHATVPRFLGSTKQ